MNLEMPRSLGNRYTSAAQKARVVTEGWAEENLFCPACSQDHLVPSPTNTRAIDFVCDNCSQTFQLKGKSSPIVNKVVDGSYTALMSALNSDTAPNLLLLHYQRPEWTVKNLLLIPYFAFSSSAIECRKPLSATARRAGWVGCFIVLSRIPSDARIGVVSGGIPSPQADVRKQYQRLLPLKRIEPLKRGWTLDVFSLIKRLGKREFVNADLYNRADELRALYPDNKHVTDKIRQQLQILRDSGLLKHNGRGHWQLVEAE